MYMGFIAFAWFSSSTYAIGSVIGKISTKHHIANPWLYNWVWYILTIVFIIPFAVANRVGLPQDWPSMLHLGVANAVSGTLFVLAFYAVDLSVLSPLSNLRTPVAALIGALIFREALTPMQQILIAVVFLAGLLIQYEEKFSLRKLRSRGIVLMDRYYSLAVSSVLMTAGLLFSIRAFAENISISTAIISVPLSMLLTVGLAYFRPELLEKHTAKVYAVRLVSAVVMFGAALALSG